MRRLFLMLIAVMLAFLWFGCNGVQSAAHKVSATRGADPGSTRQSFRAQGLLSLADAEKILGEQVVLRDSSSTVEGQATIYRCTYAAADSNRDGNRKRVIYFLFEEYPNVTAAHEVYARIKVANQHHEGIETLQGVGDEAYFHSDGQNFYFIMVRKGRRGIRIKATKLSSTVSYEAFNDVARRIASQL